MKKMRADALVAAQLGADSLQLARSLIMAGRVMAGDQKVLTAGEMLPCDTVMRLLGGLDSYVSRGAHKLKRALEAFSIALEGATCIDVGASTGGFTDVMLRAGAQRVYAVDVGYNLLEYSLRSDQRVICMERTNARFIRPDDFDPRPQFGATDVSFISLKAILPAALGTLTGGQERFVALIKPQFEAPKEDVGDKGVVRDPRVHAAVIREIASFVRGLGWIPQDLDYSPIQGAEGNIEFLLDIAAPSISTKMLSESTIVAIIEGACDKFIKSHK